MREKKGAEVMNVGRVDDIPPERAVDLGGMVAVPWLQSGWMVVDVGLGLWYKIELLVSKIRNVAIDVSFLSGLFSIS